MAMSKREREYINAKKREYGSPLKGRLLEDTSGIAHGEQIKWFLNDVIPRLNPDDEYKIVFKLQIP